MVKSTRRGRFIGQLPPPLLRQDQAPKIDQGNIKNGKIQQPLYYELQVSSQSPQ